MKDPAAVAQRAFDALEAKLDKRLPRIRYIAAGEIAYDCDSFVVTASEVYQGFPGARAPGNAHSQIILSTDLRVYVIRTVEGLDNSGRQVNYPALQKTALDTLSDTTALAQALFDAVDDGTLADPCDDVVFGGIVIDGPEGGALATILTISIQL